jgi:hypothetical protein
MHRTMNIKLTAQFCQPQSIVPDITHIHMTMRLSKTDKKGVGHQVVQWAVYVSGKPTAPHLQHTSEEDGGSTFVPNTGHHLSG